MKIERTKNASRNIIFGSILKIYQIVVPFLMRTVMIYFMGVQYLGLNSLFTSILQVLNLTELGVGSAMVYSMYKPIADDDTRTICALIRLYRLYYRIIGSVIAVIGGILTPFIPYLVKSDLPTELNIYVLYLFNLGATVLSYWLFAYKSALFHAHQRLDVTSKITLVTNTIQYAIQLIIVIFLKDYYLYVLAFLLTQALTNIVTAVAATKKYPEYEPRGKLTSQAVKEINQRIRDLFTSKIGAVIVNSADTVVISAFLGLTVLAVYQNYYYILTSIIGLVATIFSACTAGIGNSVIVETKEKNFNERLDGIIYSVFLSLGFATIENIIYILLEDPISAFKVGIIRSIISVPAHMMFGIIMGYYISKYKFTSSKIKKRKYLALSIILPILLHGVFDFILMIPYRWSIIVFVVYIVYLWKSSLDKLDEYTNNSRRKFLRRYKFIRHNKRKDD